MCVWEVRWVEWMGFIQNIYPFFYHALFSLQNHHMGAGFLLLYWFWWFRQKDSLYFNYSLFHTLTVYKLFDNQTAFTASQKSPHTVCSCFCMTLQYVTFLYTVFHCRLHAQNTFLCWVGSFILNVSDCYEREEGDVFSGFKLYIYSNAINKLLFMLTLQLSCLFQLCFIQMITGGWILYET